jgi:hypothetical protein
MTWFREHPRATLALSVALYPVMALVLYLTGTSGAVWFALLVPYAIAGLVNAWVLRMKGRSLHWLWLYLIYNWGGAIVPLMVAFLAKPLQQPVHQQV